MAQKQWHRREKLISWAVVIGKAVHILTQLAGAGIGIAAGKIKTDAHTKQIFKAVAPIITLLGFVWGNAATDSYTKLIDDKKHEADGNIALAEGAESNGHAQNGRAATQNVYQDAQTLRWAKAKISLYYEGIPALLTAASNVVAAFFSTSNLVAGSAFAGSVIGGIFGLLPAALLNYDRSKKGHSPALDYMSAKTITQLFCGLGALVGLAIGIRRGSWLNEALNPAGTFLSAAVPAIAKIFEILSLLPSITLPSITRRCVSCPVGLRP